MHIGERPGISFSDLSHLLICDKSNATRIIKGLEGDGLVYRRPHETDGRALRLYLSDKGKALRKKAIAAHQNYNNNRFVRLPATEQESLSQGLRDLKQSLSQHLGQEAAL